MFLRMAGAAPEGLVMDFEGYALEMLRAFGTLEAVKVYLTSSHLLLCFRDVHDFATHDSLSTNRTHSTSSGCYCLRFCCFNDFSIWCHRARENPFPNRLFILHPVLRKLHCHHPSKTPMRAICSAHCVVNWVVHSKAVASGGYPIIHDQVHYNLARVGVPRAVPQTLSLIPKSSVATHSLRRDSSIRRTMGCSSCLTYICTVVFGSLCQPTSGIHPYWSDGCLCLLH
mmetsp:Transcript_45144/g.79452  ORF Transcript_45144/g.79452 Transcript_45144/m.79452 type:complete len:227 (-) Transcript_45144:506-1186(-)